MLGLPHYIMSAYISLQEQHIYFHGEAVKGKIFCHKERVGILCQLLFELNSYITSIKYIVFPSVNTVSSPHTCPSHTISSTRVFSNLWGLLFSASYLHTTVPISTPPTPSTKPLFDFSLCDWHLINEEGLVSLSLQLW